MTISRYECYKIQLNPPVAVAGVFSFFEPPQSFAFFESPCPYEVTLSNIMPRGERFLTDGLDGGWWWG